MNAGNCEPARLKAGLDEVYEAFRTPLEFHLNAIANILQHAGDGLVINHLRITSNDLPRILSINWTREPEHTYDETRRHEARGHSPGESQTP